MESIKKYSEEKIRTLIVDDDRVMRMILSRHIEERGHEVLSAANGKEGMVMLESGEDIDLMVLDREMPEMSGMEVVRAMKGDKRFSKIPIIMATGSGNPEQVKEGIDAGVFYYLTKPVNEEILVSVISAAERDVLQRKTLSTELSKHKGSFGLMHLSKFYIKGIEEAEDLSVFLSNCYSDPERVVSGIAELLVNAVEHGNLAITYDEKSELIEQDRWREEIERRLILPEYGSRRVLVAFRRNEDGIYLRVRDEGQGFDWMRYLEIDPARAADNHGRGIAQANAVSFDELKYNTAGNQVTAIVREAEEIEW